MTLHKPGMWCESYITFVHSFKLFQIWGGTRRLQSFRVNGSLVRKQSEWKRWDAESLDQKKCHYQDEKIVITRHKTDAEYQETDWWWYFATKVYPEQVTTHTNKHRRLLGIISRILSDNNNIGVSILVHVVFNVYVAQFPISLTVTELDVRVSASLSDLAVSNRLAISLTAQCIITTEPHISEEYLWRIGCCHHSIQGSWSISAPKDIISRTIVSRHG